MSDSIKNIMFKYGNKKEHSNLVFLTPEEHHKSHTLRYSKADVHYTKMLHILPMMNLENTYYNLGYTIAVDGEIEGVDVPAKFEDIYLDGLMCGIGDKENNTVDENNIISEEDIKLLALCAKL